MLNNGQPIFNSFRGGRTTRLGGNHATAMNLIGLETTCFHRLQFYLRIAYFCFLNAGKLIPRRKKSHSARSVMDLHFCGLLRHRTWSFDRASRVAVFWRKAFSRNATHLNEPEPTWSVPRSAHDTKSEKEKMRQCGRISPRTLLRVCRRERDRMYICQACKSIIYITKMRT